MRFLSESFDADFRKVEPCFSLVRKGDFSQSLFTFGCYCHAKPGEVKNLINSGFDVIFGIAKSKME